ncbi:MAG: hypothetical protein ACLUSP_05815 [Christensenellales bacterium]
MFFDQQNFSARMLTATTLSWERQKVNVQMRAYDSLSLRLVGNGTIVLGGATYTVKAGDVMYLPAGYGYEADYSATEMIAIHFTETSTPVRRNRDFRLFGQGSFAV